MALVNWISWLHRHQGTIENTGGGFLFISATLTNSGTIQETSGGFIEILGAVDNTGTIKEKCGGAISINFDQYDPPMSAPSW